jgi:hypothetical protein
LTTIARVPNDEDYAWLAWLIAHPADWDEKDLSTARFLLRNQRESLETHHTRDRTGRLAAQKLIDELQGAIDAHVNRRS